MTWTWNNFSLVSVYEGLANANFQPSILGGVAVSISIFFDEKNTLLWFFCSTQFLVIMSFKFILFHAAHLKKNILENMQAVGFFI